jgi:hypothetical protein
MISAAPAAAAPVITDRRVSVRPVTGLFISFLTIIFSWSRLVPRGVVLARGLSWKSGDFAMKIASPRPQTLRFPQACPAYWWRGRAFR